MKVGFICPQCNDYKEYKNFTCDQERCPQRNEIENNNSDVQINVFKESDVEVSPDNRYTHIGSKRDRKEAEKRYGIAPIEEIRDRANESQSKKSSYSLSEEQNKLNSIIKRNGINATLYDKHPLMRKAYRRSK